MAPPRSFQVLGAVAFLLLVFALLSSGTFDASVSSNGDSQQSGTFSTLTNKFNLWPLSGGNRGSTWLQEKLRRSEEIYQRMIAQRAQLYDEYEAAGHKKL